MRRYLVIILALCLAGLLLWLLLRHQGGELADIMRLIPRIRLYLLFLSLLLQLVFLLDQAVLYRIIYTVLGWPVALGRLYLLTLASTTAGRLVPVGTPAGVAVFAGEAARDGISPWSSVLNNALFYLFDYLTFFLFLGGGLLYLSTRHQLTTGQLTTSLVLLALILAAVLLLVLVMFKRDLVRQGAARLLSWTNSLGRKYRGKDFFATGPILRGLEEVLEQLGNLRYRKRDMALVAFWAVMLQVIDLAILYSLFASLHQPVSPGVLVTGFGLATLFAHITFIPNGMGIYAASMAWVYTSLGIPWSVATAVALLYRAVTFWFPIPIGAVAWHLARRRADHVLEP
ncbi:MAG: flippase-like domain-containing protein [Clostridia bacterium]|nr:MAG: flippase-like domain-containing protein [Clostridia bacterium]